MALGKIKTMRFETLTDSPMIYIGDAELVERTNPERLDICNAV